MTNFKQIFCISFYSGETLCLTAYLSMKIDEAGLVDVEITEAKIRKAIGNLKLNKAEGVDNIH